MSSIVAVAGLEPATCFRFTRNPLLPTELHGTIYIERPHRKLLEATPARNPAALLGLHQSFVSSVKYPHSCGSFGFHSLPPFPRPYTTTFPPYCLCVGANSWPMRGSEITLSPPVVLTGLNTVSSTPSACRSLSLPFRFDTRTGLRPGCCTSSVISTNAFAYLPGLSLYVPRRLWKVRESNPRSSYCYLPVAPFTGLYLPNLILMIIVVPS